MGYKIWVNALLLQVMLSSCLFRKNHVDYADEAMFSYAKELKEKKGFELGGFGGAMMYDIERFSLYFYSSETPHLEEARKLYVETMENFIQKVNEDPNIRPYLHDHPITYQNFELHLSFSSSKKLPPSQQFVSSIFIAKGKICYMGYDPEKHELFGIHKEPYEEAVKIVQGMN